jgi:hypothetical protein
MELKEVIGPPFRFLDAELLDRHDFVRKMNPRPVSFLKPREKEGQPVGSHQPKGRSFSEHRGISGGKKEMNQIGRVVGVKMGEKIRPMRL